MTVIKINELCEMVRGRTDSISMTESLDLVPSPIDRAGSGSITFCSKKDPAEALAAISASGAKVVICSNELEIETAEGKILVFVSHPRMAFIKTMQRYFEEKVAWGISPTAIIDPDARIHPESYIGPNTVIGKSEVGKGTVIYGNVSIYSKVVIGERVTVNSGSVIGADGYGYERDERGRSVKFPSIGGVVVEDDVDIGSNTCIDRGTLDSTRIGRGTKIDNLCHIAHNVIVGRNCSIIAQSMIGGSVIIGDYAWIAPSACIRDGIRIGKNSTVGLGAVVTKDVPDNAVVMGVPAKTIRENPIPQYTEQREDKK